MKKKLVTGMAVLLCAATLAMTGCGQKQEGKKENVFEPQLDTEENVVLSVAGFFGNFEALDQVIADFNEYYPNVEFAYEQTGIDNFKTYVETKSNIDIMMTSQEIFEKMGDTVNPMCTDLSKVDINLSDIDENMLDRCYYDGKLACIPIGQSTCGLVVNVSLLEKEGLEIPTNYEEFSSVLKTLKEKGYTPLQGPNSKVYAELTKTMLYDVILDDKELQEGLKTGEKSAVEKLHPVYDRLNDMIAQGYIDPAVNEKYPEDNYDKAILNFFEGDVPFWVCDTERVSGMKKRESKSETFQKEPFTYTYIYAPLGEKGVYAFKEPWFGFSVNKNAANYDYAMEFMRFFTTKDEINKMANIKGIPSVAVENVDLDIYQNINNPEKIELEGINKGEISWSLRTKWYSNVNNYVAGEYETDTEALEDFVKMCSE